MDLRLNKHSIHIWRVHVPDFFDRIDDFSKLLSSDELKRAERFHFDIHRHRFIVARSVLRQILSLYTKIKPQQIVFDKSERGKPRLHDHTHRLQFNVSHSGDWAVIAITSEHEIGVDIEKIDEFKEEVAKRFFSPEEYQQLMQLSSQDKIIGFYRLWSAKEAFIKAIGGGLFILLHEFSVDLGCEKQLIKLKDQQQGYWVEEFFVADEYQASVAYVEEWSEFQHWEWKAGGAISI